MAYRVVVWGTGSIGQIAIRAIAARPDLQLVGTGVYSADKRGLDCGLMAGTAANGIATTDDIGALIALRPRCVVYAGRSEHQAPAALGNIIRFLEAGIDVVTTSSTALMHPPSMDPVRRSAVEEAAVRGNASVYATGIEPGFAGDHFPLMLSMMSENIRTIRVQEIFRYDGYPVATALKQGMGFGMSMSYEPLMAAASVQTAMWGPSIYKIADRLGEQVDGIRCTFAKRVTERRLEVACGIIDAGTVGAIRFETIAVIGHREPIVIEHINRMADDIAEDWPSAARNGTYRVLLDGSPNLTCDLVVGLPETFSVEGRVATTMLMVNAIPYVCEARAGLLTSLDLPFNTPRHMFRC